MSDEIMFEQMTTRQVANINIKLKLHGFTQDEANRFLSDESTDIRYPEWLSRDRQRRHDKKHHPVLQQVCGDSCGED